MSGNAHIWKKDMRLPTSRLTTPIPSNGLTMYTGGMYFHLQEVEQALRPPLDLFHLAMEHHHSFLTIHHQKSSINGTFSIAMLNCQFG